MAGAIFLERVALVVAKKETMAAKDGVLPFTIEVVEDDASLTAHAGLPLVLETMRALGLSDGVNRTLGIPSPQQRSRLRAPRRSRRSCC